LQDKDSLKRVEEIAMLSDKEKFLIREQIFEIIKIVGIPEQVSLKYEEYYLGGYPPHQDLDIQEIVDMKPYVSDDEGVVWALRYMDSQNRRNTTFFRRAL
jgi:hypothetical protein